MSFNNIPTRTTADINSAADVNQLMENLRALSGNGTLAPPISLKEIDSNKTPIGIISMYAGPDIDSETPVVSSHLYCNGDGVSRITYADLFAIIGTTYGVGDGSTTFNVPDYQAVVPKGIGTQTINTRPKTAPAFAVVEEDQMQKLTGEFDVSSGKRFSGGVTGSGMVSVGSASSDNNVFAGTSGDYSGIYEIFFNSSDSPNARTSSTTYGETRPSNQSMVKIMRIK